MEHEIYVAVRWSSFLWPIFTGPKRVNEGHIYATHKCCHSTIYTEMKSSLLLLSPN